MTTETAVLEAFIERVTHGASWRAIADAAGIDPSTLTRQINRGRVPVQTVVAICRAYGADMLEAFVAADYLTAAEAAQIASGGALRSATDLQLAREILRRVEDASATEALTGPLDIEGATVPDEGDVVEGRFGRRHDLPQTAAANERSVSWTDEAEAGEEQP